MYDTLLCLLADSTSFYDLQAWWSWLLVIFQVAFGLGFVIFVHELGHFAVAKMCGVRCDKFMVGVDVGGYKLTKQWGETEYGIGLLPIGGYVKMFGQDDNVANIEEEIRQSEALADSPDAVQIVGPKGEKHWVHRRSYLAKSVPQRMAIISAGVIMNVIFALVFAWIAYGVGAPQQPCQVAMTTPGGPAWQAGLRAGDLIVRLNEIENPTYKQLHETVILGEGDQDLDCLVERDGETFQVSLSPDRSGKLAKVGIAPPVSLRLPLNSSPVTPNGAASRASGAGFEQGDLILAVEGAEVSDYGDLVAQLLEHRSEPITYTLLRGGEPPKGDPFGPLSGGERVETTVEPNPMERLGIVPTLGPVAAVQQDSPAAAAGIEPGDVIQAVNGVALGAAADGQESWDPVTLDSRLDALAAEGAEATLTVLRGDETIEIIAQPRRMAWAELAADEDTPMPIVSLGVACEVWADVQAVVAGSPAAEAGVQQGDRIVQATLTSTDPENTLAKTPETFELGKDARTWPAILVAIQDKSDDFVVKLRIDRDGAEREVELKPISDHSEYTYRRGISLSPLKELKVASNASEQIALAWGETRDALSTVFRFLAKLTSQEIPVTALGGPVTIAKVAGYSAFEGFGSLLIALTMLSANLAVLNFLPIPVLDGGHMVFLAWEGITGRPPNEKFVMALSILGFVFLVSLMLFVTLLDVGLISRGL